jgi:hypothetical protein
MAATDYHLVLLAYLHIMQVAVEAVFIIQVMRALAA